MRINKTGIFGLVDDADEYAHLLPMAGVRFLLAVATSPSFTFVDAVGTRTQLSNEETQIIEKTIANLTREVDMTGDYGFAWLRNGLTAPIGATSVLALDFSRGVGFDTYPFIVPEDGYYRVSCTFTGLFSNGIEDPDQTIVVYSRLYSSLDGTVYSNLSPARHSDYTIHRQWDKVFYLPAGAALDMRVFLTRKYNFNPNVVDVNIFGSSTEALCGTFMEIRRV